MTVVDSDAGTESLARGGLRAAVRGEVGLEDGTRLAYRGWMPEGEVRGVMLLIHRGHEHSGRFEDLVGELAVAGVAVFAWDQRGHGDTVGAGEAPGERGWAPSLACVVRDLDFWARHVCAGVGLGLEDVVAVGHSIGAVTLAAWVHDYAVPVRGMVLVAPAFAVKLYVPLAVPGLRFLQKVRGGRKTFVKSYVKAKMLTHDAGQAAAYEADPKIARSIAVNMLLDLHDTSARLVEDAGTVEVPALVLNAGKDWVVKPGMAGRFFERLGSRVKRLRTFDGMYHDLLHEKDRGEVLSEIRGFAEEAFGGAAVVNVSTEAQGLTAEEHERLRKPLPWWSMKGWNFAMQRLSMKTLGRLSVGMSLGWKTGFSSGATLDYVYENRARGAVGLGKMLDRTYLDAIGWRGIRVRKGHVQELVRKAAERVAAAGGAGGVVRIVDVAAGPGRYLVEMAGELKEKYGAEMLLRDGDAAGLAQGRAMAEGMGVTNVRFEVGDAFDEAGLAGMVPRPSVVVVSGLFELFAENERVMRTLRGVAAAMRERGGYLVYTGQPWHPQLEMIARVLVGFDGKAWAMRRRSQWELDGLVRAAGFEKVEQRVDGWGIFTVSMARVGAT